MADIILELTTAGRALRAKIEQGNGDIPFEITRIVAGAGSSGDPLNQTGVIDPRQEFAVTSKNTVGPETIFKAMLTNVGDPNADPPVPPLAVGYPLAQIGFYAIDPDVGEILYNITQFVNPAPVPAASERPWTYKPEFVVTTANASEVIIQLTPSGWLSQDDLEPIIQQLSGHIGRGGTAQHPLADGVTPGFSEFNYTQDIWQRSDGIRLLPDTHPDLDDVLEPGTYFVQSNAETAAIANSPFPAAFTLEVLRWGRGGAAEGRVIQRATAHSSALLGDNHRVVVRTIRPDINFISEWQEIDSTRLFPRTVTPDLNDWLPASLRGGMYFGERTTTLNAPAAGWFRYIGLVHDNIAAGWSTILAFPVGSSQMFMRAQANDVWQNWQEVPTRFATQAEVNAGVLANVAVAPNTLASRGIDVVRGSASVSLPRDTVTTVNIGFSPSLLIIFSGVVNLGSQYILRGGSLSWTWSLSGSNTFRIENTISNGFRMVNISDTTSSTTNYVAIR